MNVVPLRKQNDPADIVRALRRMADDIEAAEEQDIELLFIVLQTSGGVVRHGCYGRTFTVAEEVGVLQCAAINAARGMPHGSD